MASPPLSLYENPNGMKERMRKDIKNERERISRAHLKYQFDTLAEILDLNRYSRLQKGAILGETIKALQKYKEENTYLKQENARLNVELSKVTASLRNAHVFGGSGETLNSVNSSSAVSTSSTTHSLLSGEINRVQGLPSPPPISHLTTVSTQETLSAQGSPIHGGKDSSLLDGRIQRTGMKSPIVKSEIPSPPSTNEETNRRVPTSETSDSRILNLISQNGFVCDPKSPEIAVANHTSIKMIKSESEKIARPLSPKRNRNGNLKQPQIMRQLETDPFDLTDIRRASDEITTKKLKKSKKSKKYVQNSVPSFGGKGKGGKHFAGKELKHLRVAKTDDHLRRRSSSGTSRFFGIMQNENIQDPMASTGKKAPVFQSTVVNNMTEEELEKLLDSSNQKLRRSLSDGFLDTPSFYEDSNVTMRGSRGSLGPIRMSITPRSSVDSFSGLMAGNYDPFARKVVKFESEDILLSGNMKEGDAKSPSELLVEDCMNSPWSPITENLLQQD